MKVVEARDLWLGELTTNGASKWTNRNYLSATNRAISAIAASHDVAASEVELDRIDRDDIVAVLAAYAETTDPATGAKQCRAQLRYSDKAARRR